MLAADDIGDAEESESEAPKKKKAKRSDYIALMMKVAKGEMRRNLLDNLLYVKTKEGWEDLLGYLPIVRSEAREKGKFFELSGFDDHAAWLRTTLPSRLLIDIPAWDGEDRIAEICEHLDFQGVDVQTFYECILQFGAVMFQRLEDPSIQPITPIINGPQGVGKDTLIDALVGGLGDYHWNLNLKGHDMTEAERMLYRAVCFNIPEFDRASRKDVSTLKYLLSTSFTTVRDPYERSAKKKWVRASFIASVNIADVLVDETGSRRYWLFTMTNGGFKMRQLPNGKLVGLKPPQLNDFSEKRGPYPGHYMRGKKKLSDRMQILAQFKALAQRGFSASAKAIAEVEATNDSHVPDAIDDLIVEEFQAGMRKHLESIGLTAQIDLPQTLAGERLIPNPDLSPLIDKIARSFGRTNQSVRRTLKAAGLQYRKKNFRGWLLPTEQSDEAPELTA